MKRFLITLQLLCLLLIAVSVTPRHLSAATASCTDQYSSCINAASAYKGSATLQTMAEAECGLEYEGCVIRKLKFW